MRYPVIGNYVLLDEIGRGAFGEVRLALNLDTMQPVAVKIINKEKAREYSSSAAVRKEIKIMQELQHPNVVNLIEVISTQSRVLVMMDLVEGGELYDEVSQFGRLSEPYARFFFKQLVNGLEYCHSNGVYHRDLKLDNLLLDRNKTLKISDFGMSTYKTRLEKMLHTPVGTPMFVAPELIGVSAEGYSGAKSDVWSCGIILFMMCSGKVPFQSDNLHYLFHQIKRCYVEYPAYFSEDLKDLLSRIFQPNMNNRISLKKVINHPWMAGPITTSEVGDDRRNAPSKVQLMSRKIQEVIQSYNSYKQEAALLKDSTQSLVPIVVNPAPASRANTSTQPAASVSNTRKSPAFDSLAIGWVKDTDIGLSASPLPGGGSSMRIPNCSTNRVSDASRNLAAITESPVPQTETTESGIEAELESGVSTVTASDDENESSDGIGHDADTDSMSVSDQWSRSTSNRKLSYRSFGSRTSRYDSELELESEYGSFPSKQTDLRPVRSLSDFAIGRNAATYSSDDRSYLINNGDPEKLEMLRHALWHSFAASRKSRQHMDSAEESTDNSHNSRTRNSTSAFVRSKSLSRAPLPHSKERFHTKPNSDAEASKPLPSSKPKSDGVRTKSAKRVRFPSPSLSSTKPLSQYATSDESNDTEPGWWCTVGEMNMIPEVREFGLDAKQLDALWAAKLAQQSFRPPARKKKSERLKKHSSKKQAMRNPYPNATVVQEGGYTQTVEQTPDEISVVQSLPAIKLEEAYVVEGDVLTMSALDEESIKKFVEKSRFDYDEEAALELARKSCQKNPGCRAVEYYTYLVSIARGAKHSTLKKLKENNNVQETLDTNLELHRAFETTACDGESLLTDICSPGNEPNKQNVKEKKQMRNGLRRLAIGPLHEDYKRKSSDKNKDKDNDCTSSEQERSEIAKKLKIFDIPMSGPSPEDALIRPAMLPFEQYFKKPRQVVKRMATATVDMLSLARHHPQYTIVFEMEVACAILHDCLSRDGAEVHELQKSDTRARFQINHDVDGCKLRMLATVTPSETSDRYSSLLLQRKSGSKDKYAEFATSLDDKLCIASDNYNRESRSLA